MATVGGPAKPLQILSVILDYIKDISLDLALESSFALNRWYGGLVVSIVISQQEDPGFECMHVLPVCMGFLFGCSGFLLTPKICRLVNWKTSKYE